MSIDFTSITNNTASYWVIFLYGIMTSFHCIGMCGGFILSGSLSINNDKAANIKTSFLYNAGRIISYTVIGGIAGGVGSVVALSGTLKGGLPFVAGILMVIMGLNFLGILKKIKISFSLKKFFPGEVFESKNKNMLFIGLMSGVLPCGPMQAVQIYSLATASIIKGALAMFIFSIGTVPVLFLFGYFSTFLNVKFTKVALKSSAVVLIFMGFFMVNRGLNLWGVKVDAAQLLTKNNYSIAATVKGDEQVLITEFTNEKFYNVAFKKGIPVKWIINVDKKYVGECTSTIVIEEYDVKVELHEGENIINFTPEEAKEVNYSSWCGMLSGVITIYE
ncbi:MULTISPECIES: sulfite exporter TauE/SafE family protein [unclassified Clostridium]|uniref:sulfite exporter TauE/SafE family protein n=1 Tax=unclassified Clostridium TaxID=2614128 RepID=UPI0002985814|nr:MULTISPECIES: sulfite exporter TauE/SafE family protein [unclassified Clostridium]EKQ53831.1 MAG: hypothetical protein A370_03577 [Clostridium sp. Maddingley MBC34-26]